MRSSLRENRCVQSLIRAFPHSWQPSMRRVMWMSVCCTLLLMARSYSAPDQSHGAGRSQAERAHVVIPEGLSGKPGGARRNAFFDHWNEQIVREDAFVSTVFLGDSITERWDLAVYFKSTDGLIENRGVSGDLASKMLLRLQADVIQLRPRNVVILAGTNDVSKIVGGDKDSEEIVREVTASVESLVKATRSAGINTLVCSILPTNSDYARHGMRSQLRGQINERIRAVCAAAGAAYVDYASTMSDANGNLRKDYSADGVHPNSAGFEVMARVLEQALAAQGWRP